LKNFFLQHGVKQVAMSEGNLGYPTGRARTYAIVRHPGYAGGSLLLAGIALCLGSVWALVPSGLASAVLILRTTWEDQTLQAELPGYKDYTQRVRFKLIPGVW
jgi:protein-S-isoprenylcysteine O-methyltransferase Ste14